MKSMAVEATLLRIPGGAWLLVVVDFFEDLMFSTIPEGVTECFNDLKLFFISSSSSSLRKYNLAFAERNSSIELILIMTV
jgi:hypothetical protein